MLTHGLITIPVLGEDGVLMGVIFAENVQNFIRSELLIYCDQERWIDDCVGEGPIRIEE